MEPRESQQKQKGKTHDHARGGTTVLQGQKGGTAVPPTVEWLTATRTAVRVTVRPRTAGRAVLHGRVSSGFRNLTSIFRLFSRVLCFGV